MFGQKQLWVLQSKLQSVFGSTLRGVAKEYGLSECTARFRLKKINEGKSLEKVEKSVLLTKRQRAAWLNVLVLFAIMVLAHQ